MAYSISIFGQGAVDDDLRDAFGELVRNLRAATPDAPGNSFGGSLSTGAANYTVDDIPDGASTDDDSDEEDAQP
jgi:hypothetical protein